MSLGDEDEEGEVAKSMALASGGFDFRQVRLMLGCLIIVRRRRGTTYEEKKTVEGGGDAAINHVG